MKRCELELLREEIIVRVIPLEEAPVTLGRNHGNAVVLLDETVSGHHAIAWLAPDGPHLTDLHSKNGTFLNDKQVTGTVKLADEDVLRLGDETQVRVRSRGMVNGALVLKDLTAGIATLLDESRCVIGADEDCDIQLQSGPANAAVVLVHDNMEVNLSIGEDYTQLEVGDTFEVGGHSFKLETFAGVGATRPARERAKFSYELSVRLMGDGGPAAIFKDTRKDVTHIITSENRVALLYVLAKKRSEGLTNETLKSEAGWCSDDDVMQGIWGRAAQRNSPSGYSVLLFRIRKELEGAGFDPWFVEKRRGATRLALDTITLL